MMFNSIIRATFSNFQSQANIFRLVNIQSVLYEQVRGNVRWYFEKCSEIKRIRKYGWKKRMSTPGGRRIIMRRILKGRHVLTH